MPPYHHGNLRQTLIDATMTSVREGRAASLSLRGIATSLGVSPAAMYHHFTDKTHLLEAVVGEIGCLLIDRMRAAKRDAPAGQGALALGYAYLDFAAEEPALFAEMMSRGDCPPGQLAQSEALALVVEALREENLVAEPTDENLHLASIAAWALAHGFAALVASRMVSLSEAKAAFAADVTARQQLGSRAG